MCQVTPFDLPCCRRLYVLVERLPSCPEGWPRKKCPKELIVQISGYEPKTIQHRDEGICWRCVADRRGLTGVRRDELRPVLDTALIVEGLEEWNMDERRIKTEKAGYCWHCGADRGCDNCGDAKPKLEEGAFKGVKRGRAAAGANRKGNGVEKRFKVEHPSPVPQMRSRTSPPASFQQTVEPELAHYDHNSAAYGHQPSKGQAYHTSPNAKYQHKQIENHAPIAQMQKYGHGEWQDPQDFQDQGSYLQQSIEGGEIDPTMYQQLGEQQDPRNFGDQGLYAQNIPSEQNDEQAIDPALFLQQPQQDLQLAMRDSLPRFAENYPGHQNYNQETIGGRFSDPRTPENPTQELNGTAYSPLTPSSIMLSPQDSNAYQYQLPSS